MNNHVINSVKLILACAVSAAFANTANASANLDIETVRVVGQINSLLIESEIDLTSSSSPDLRKQLTQLPSVSVNSNGMVSGIVQYRGMFSDRVQLSIDNTLIAGAGPNYMDSPLSHVIGTQSQQVTVYQGIAPVSAGAETIGGAIDITESLPLLGHSSEYEISGVLNAGKFSNDSKLGSVLLQATNNKSYVAISADIQSGNNVEAGNGIVLPNTFFERSGVKLRAGYEAGKHKLDWSITTRDTNESGTPTLAMDIIYIDALISHLSYRYELNNEWELKAKLSANNNEHGMDNFGLRSSPSNAQHRLNTVDGKGRGMSLTAFNTYSNWENEYGVHIDQRTHNSYITNPNMAMFYLHNYNDVSRNTASVYGQWQQTPSHVDMINNWQLGIRLTQVSSDAKTIDSSMASMSPALVNLRNTFNRQVRQLDFNLVDIVAKTSFDMNENIQVQASIGIKEKAPGYYQLYSWFPLGVSAGLADGRNYLGNLELKKESANKIDFSAIVKGDDWSFMPSVFYARINDYIIGLPSQNMSANMIASMNNIANPLVWENDEATLCGFDFTYANQLTSELSLQLTGQYVRGKQTGSIKQDLYRIAPLSANISLVYASDNYEVSLLSQMVAKQTKVAQLQNETNTAGYAVFDAHFAYMFSSGITLKVIAENIFDKNYADHLSGISRVNDVNWPAGNKQLSPGRNIGAYVSYQF